MVDLVDDNHPEPQTKVRRAPTLPRAPAYPDTTTRAPEALQRGSVSTMHFQQEYRIRQHFTTGKETETDAEKRHNKLKRAKALIYIYCHQESINDLTK